MSTRIKYNRGANRRILVMVSREQYAKFYKAAQAINYSLSKYINKKITDAENLSTIEPIENRIPLFEFLKNDRKLFANAVNNLNQYVRVANRYKKTTDELDKAILQTVKIIKTYGEMIEKLDLS
jgi:hypothetical protein